ncbi:GNAT family N-acetyltransferase [Enterococcus rivorum]|uniref:N-acetyltransferase domain-containing protein n=1 Tax=Enterococcus rivorum TaxID=762845 RepID=A0A1E5KXQ1_9ENTE|nr:GNAT family N-acetyltransferase [Enterococcus rivorum]MBP2099501.1 GNAT superfamily N-acetyltransferase [Enterococcus rivorum]OEH82613.1 hypothetical protein BCR26_12790 [Enterococcus rivorum]
MKVSHKKFEKKYLESCMALIKSTWLFEEDFAAPKHPEYIYKYYVLNCVNWSQHLDLLVDQNDQVQGILFGSIEDVGYLQSFLYALVNWKNQFEIWWHILLGDLGDQKQARKVYQEMQSYDRDGEALAKEFDGEINLFIVSPKLRGQGYGQQLMKRYLDFCRKRGVEKVFLWTTTDCNWKFYERYGFQVRAEFALTKPNASIDTSEQGIVFQLTISDLSISSKKKSKEG